MIGSGFLHTGASWGADMNLAVQLAMGLCLLLGARFARQGNFTAHGRCQTSVVILNLFVIAGFMLPAFRLQIAPRVPGGLKDAYHAAAFAHGVLGLGAELLAIYVVLVARTGLVPERLRFKSYRPWMRTTLGLWWSAILLGVLTYAVWYVVPSPSAGAQSATAVSGGAEKIVVEKLKFVPPELTIAPGTTVVWIGLDGRHSVEADDGSFKATDKEIESGRFEHRFDRPGVFPFFCENHGGPGGKGMSGVIHVQ